MQVQEDLISRHYRTYTDVKLPLSNRVAMKK